jgi:putative FmdB family regulatory protein
MPLYEYECASCQKIHEVMQKFSDQPLQQCPDCGAEVRKLMSMSSFSLKGSGWYSTDYKKTSAPTSTPAKSAPSAQAASAASSAPTQAAASPSPSSSGSGAGAPASSST